MPRDARPWEIASIALRFRGSNAFLAEHPEGGDITDIVVEYRRASKQED
jgi:hypothetical protein